MVLLNIFLVPNYLIGLYFYIYLLKQLIQEMLLLLIQFKEHKIQLKHVWLNAKM
jgi:hypothetical protein